MKYIIAISLMISLWIPVSYAQTVSSEASFDVVFREYNYLTIQAIDLLMKQIAELQRQVLLLLSSVPMRESIPQNLQQINIDESGNIIEESSNGRTAGFEPANKGSTPFSSAGKTRIDFAVNP